MCGIKLLIHYQTYILQTQPRCFLVGGFVFSSNNTLWYRFLLAVMTHQTDIQVHSMPHSTKCQSCFHHHSRQNIPPYFHPKCVHGHSDMGRCRTNHCQIDDHLSIKYIYHIYHTDITYHTCTITYTTMHSKKYALGQLFVVVWYWLIFPYC